MFDSLSQGLEKAWDIVRKDGKLTADNIKGPMREIRRALLEADVCPCVLPLTLTVCLIDVLSVRLCCRSARERLHSASASLGFTGCNWERLQTGLQLLSKAEASGYHPCHAHILLQMHTCAPSCSRPSYAILLSCAA